MATTDNMSLVLPTVSETLGPEWAEELNEALEVIDLHDHSEGKGVPVTPAGLDINDALDMQNQRLENLALAVLQALAAANTSYAGSIQRVGGNLYWINGGGTAVQLTSGSSVVSAGSGALSVNEPVSFPYSVTTGDNSKVLVIPTDASAKTLNLPAATNAMTVYIKDKSLNAQTNNITITPNGTDTIDGANTNYVVNANGVNIGLISDGVSAWYVI
jgi:hypothetical protein